MQRVRLAALAMATALAGCTLIPNVGPSTNKIEEYAGQAGPDAAVIQLVTVDDAVARRLLAQRKQRLFSEGPRRRHPTGRHDRRPGRRDRGEHLGGTAGDAVLERGLVGPARRHLGIARRHAAGAGDRPRRLRQRSRSPARSPAAGRSLPDIEQEVARRLKGKANQPEILVRRVRNASATVTVVGEVGNSVKVPLTPSGERLLDALAAAGGVRQPVNKMTVQITRGSDFYSMPLQTVIRDPRQNVSLQAGDVVTAIAQSLSFTALGSTIKNEEINFEAQGITLAQALARAGGLNDNRSDARGVFIFRFEPDGRASTGRTSRRRPRPRAWFR
jgi:polysaccharide export outer membrane protein